MKKTEAIATRGEPFIEELLDHGIWLRRLAARLVQGESEAEDLVQETWVAALTAGPATAEEARPWLRRVLANRAGMSWRTRGRRTQREREVARCEALPSAAELAGRAERGRRLVESVLELPEDPQRILLLRYYEGLSSAEIARKLGRPAGTVRSQLARALALLREKLDAQSAGGREEWTSALALWYAPSAARIGRGLALSAPAKLGAAAIVLAGASLALQHSLPGEDARHEQLATPASAPDSSSAKSVLISSLSPERLRVALTADRGPQAPIAIRVVDPASAQPVPLLALALAERREDGQAGDVLEELRTDLQGLAHSATAHAPGDYLLIPIEDRARTRAALPDHPAPQPRAAIGLTHALDDSGAALEVMLEHRVGPLFRIECDQLEQVGPLAAILSRSPRVPEAGWSQPTLVRDQPSAHARFAPLTPKVRRGATHLLLLSLDGRWVGRTEVELDDSPAPREIAIELVPAGTLELRIRYPEGPGASMVVAQTWPGVQTVAAIDVLAPVAHAARFTRDVNGVPRILLRWVPAGELSFAVEGVDFEPVVRSIEFPQGGATHEVELLRANAGESVIRGSVVCQGERPPDFDLQVYMDTVDRGQPSPVIRRLEFKQREGVWSADFVFEGLDQRPRFLIVREDLGLGFPRIPVTTTPRRIELVPDAEPVRFELAPTPPAVNITIEASDAKSGEPLPRFSYYAILAEGEAATENLQGVDGRAECTLHGDLTGGSLWVAAAGHALRVFALPTDADGDGRVSISVSLPAGWGAPLFTKDARTGDPIAGVEVRADDLSLGRTNAHGMLELSLPERPERLTIDAPGHVIDGVEGALFKSGRLKRAPADPLREFYRLSLRHE